MHIQRVGVIRLSLCLIVVFSSVTAAIPADSTTSSSQKQSLRLLPDYFIRLNVSRFFLRSDSFYKRQYLAEGRPDLDFHLLTINNIRFIINAAFRLGMGEFGDNIAFNFIDLATDLEPLFEISVGRYLLSTGLAHNCIHEVDTSEFPITYYNMLHLGIASPQIRLNEYYRQLVKDSLFTIGNRIAWQVEIDYYLKQFFGLVDPGKLNGFWPNSVQLASDGRYAFLRKYNWIFALYGETALGFFNKDDGFSVRNGTSVYWELSLGIQAFFTSGRQGWSFYGKYYLDDLPARKKDPAFTLGNARFSRNGLLEIGFQVFN